MPIHASSWFFYYLPSPTGVRTSVNNIRTEIDLLRTEIEFAAQALDDLQSEADA